MKEPKKCKWCEKEGNYSFGWLDENGEWHDKHLTCMEHARLSALQQNFACEMAQKREYWRRKLKKPSHYLLGITIP